MEQAARAEAAAEKHARTGADLHRVSRHAVGAVGGAVDPCIRRRVAWRVQPRRTSLGPRPVLRRPGARAAGNGRRGRRAEPAARVSSRRARGVSLVSGATGATRGSRRPHGADAPRARMAAAGRPAARVTDRRRVVGAAWPACAHPAWMSARWADWQRRQHSEPLARGSGPGPAVTRLRRRGRNRGVARASAVWSPPARARPTAPATPARAHRPAVAACPAVARWPAARRHGRLPAAGIDQGIAARTDPCARRDHGTPARPAIEVVAGGRTSAAVAFASTTRAPPSADRGAARA